MMRGFKFLAASFRLRLRFWRFFWGLSAAWLVFILSGFAPWEVPAGVLRYNFFGVLATLVGLMMMASWRPRWSRLNAAFVGMLIWVNASFFGLAVQHQFDPSYSLVFWCFSALSFTSGIARLEFNRLSWIQLAYALGIVVGPGPWVNKGVALVGLAGALWVADWLIGLYYDAWKILIHNQNRLQKRTGMENLLFRVSQSLAEKQELGALLSTVAIQFQVHRVSMWTIQGTQLVCIARSREFSQLPQLFIPPELRTGVVEHATTLEKQPGLTVWVPLKDEQHPMHGYLILEDRQGDWAAEDTQSIQLLARCYSNHLLREQMETAVEKTAKLSALGEMAAGIAHEINNPLAIVHGKANLLKMQIQTALKKEQPAPALEMLNNVQDVLATIKRIDKIVNSLRYFVKDDARNPFDWATTQEILDTVQVLSIDRCKKSGVQLTIDNQVAETDRFWCRPTQMAQVLVNLVNNSFDAVQDLPGPRWIKLGVQSTAEAICFEVQDSGSGLSPTEGERILQAFYTTKPLSSTGGSGLGLNIVKRIVETHQGKLWIDHQQTQTTFKVEIPRRRAEAA